MATPYIPPKQLLEFGNPKKRLGGLAGDSAALNWILAIGNVASSVCVIIFANSFINAYNNASSASRMIRSYNTAYYVSQFALALAALTLVFQTVYVLWVWADG